MNAATRVNDHVVIVEADEKFRKMGANNCLILNGRLDNYEAEEFMQLCENHHAFYKDASGKNHYIIKIGFPGAEQQSFCHEDSSGFLQSDQ